MEKVIVLLASYNGEKYLRDQLDSLINQTYKNLEIILVDDGSTDKSSEICDFYGNSDNRIKVVHLPNGGAGKARNIALNIVRGNYVAFVDSDDYLEKDAVQLLYEKAIATNADVVICDYKLIFQNKEQILLLIIKD